MCGRILTTVPTFGIPTTAVSEPVNVEVGVSIRESAGDPAVTRIALQNATPLLNVTVEGTVATLVGRSRRQIGC